jgi:hypothetical protein
MAVDMTDIQSLLKNVDLKSILGDSTMAETGSLGIGGGVLGAVLVGALLPRLLGDQNGLGTAATAALTPQLTAADVQNIVTSAQNSQTLGNVEGEIWKAEGQLQAALAVNTNAAALASMQSEIANLQGQGIIVKAVSDGAAAIALQGGQGIATTLAASGNVISAVNAAAAASAAGFNAVNTNVLQGTYATAQAITQDGDKTRALIQNIETASLNRQIIVAQNEATELRHSGRVTDSGVTVTNNINQTAVAQANAVAQQQIVGLLGQVATAIQHNTQSTVNLGTMIGSGQTATNVRA